MGGFSEWRRLLLLLLFRATNFFLCGHERVKRLSGETPHVLICTQRNQRAEHSSPPLHVPYSLQQNFYSYSTRHRKAWWVVEMPAKGDTQNNQHPVQCVCTQVLQHCSTAKNTTWHICAICDGYESGNKVNFIICSVVTKWKNQVISALKLHYHTFCGAVISRSGESKGASSFHINKITKEVT